MDSLSSIGDLVKATEFVGQSSGKSLRGQTQKVQQAVLEKFRRGGYNVIVATSIGEEGLDIMEVDLVICFDANISPIRMIQRMGMTGRKHDGRVVILACEGAELKAYKRKLASNKAVNKLMHNGGIKSFTFHSSPRMVPHICKPQAQFVELMIKQFIPRGKKLKEDSILRTPVSNKLLDEEKDLIAKYFYPTKEDIWEPSLIAFPVIQTFPSRIHELRHSFRTTSMLIDAMQHLQGLTMSKAKKDSSLMEVEASCRFPEFETVAANNNEQASHNATEEISQEKISVVEELEEPFKETSENVFQIPCLPVQNFSSHRFLFGEDFVTVNSLGAVLIASVPRLPYKISSIPKVIPSDGSKELFVNTINDVEEAQAVTEQKLFEADDILASQSQKQSVQKADGGVTFVLVTPVSKRKLKNQEDSVAKTPANIEINLDLSPRITHFIEEGTVPESPIVNMVPSNFTPMCEKYVLLAKSHSTSVQIRKEASPNIMKLCGPSPIEFMSTDKIEVNAQNCHCESSTKRNSEDIHTSLVNSVNNSSSENWQQNSEEALKSSLSAPKYKRLRKYGDIARKLNTEERDNCFVPNTCGPSIRTTSNTVNRRKSKRKKANKYVNSFNGFIEEEAEVSQDAEVSEDEEDGECEDHYDDSFIDDRITNTTEASMASTEAETCGDIMAFYRRSLLTQSPAENLQRCLDTHESFSAETGSSEKLYNYKCLHTPQNGLPSLDQSGGRHSVTNHMFPVKSAQLCENSGKGSSTRLESRKRKLSFQPIGEHISELEEQQPGVDLLCDDDDFYKDLDLDAVEVQATNLLRNKTGLAGPSHSAQFEEDPNMDISCSPSFDLGI